MKNNYIISGFVLYLCFSSFLFSQETTEPLCGTITQNQNVEYLKQIKPQIEKFEKEFYQLRSQESRRANFISSIPIKAHIIRASDGSGGLSETDLNNAIANLNSFYANAYLEFFLCEGINYIDEDNYYDFDASEEAALTLANNVTNSINIYFTDYVENSSGNNVCGYAYYPGGPDVIIMANNCATNGSTLPHEVGHFFSLLHTHGPSNSILTTELVDGSNCDTDGDLICDTPADPKLSLANVDESCNYTGLNTDANSDSFVPDTNNIMSYSRKACRTSFSTEQYARIYATYHTVRNNFECSSFNIDIAANVTEDCNTSLMVNFTDNSIGATSWEWDINSDGFIDYTSQNPSHLFTSGKYDVTLKISNGSQIITKTFESFINVGPKDTIPVNENFDSLEIGNTNDWESTDVNGNGFNWLVNSGETPSSNTGPIADNTTGTNDGVYFYAEATGSNPGDEAYLLSPCFELNASNPILEFAYHMNGLNTGQLRLDIQTSSGIDLDVMPVIDGEQQSEQDDLFLIRQVSLSAYSGQIIQLRFRAVRGFNWDSDIAIDDIIIYQGTLSNTNLSSIDFKIYPNPNSSNILNIDAYGNSNSYHYQFLNLLGQKVMSGNLERNQIDVSQLNSGTYFLMLTNGNNKIVKKFIRN
jgi:hypothetical protein